MGLEEHRRKGPEKVRCAIIVTSDTREAQTDRSGSTINQLLQDAGHEVTDYRIVPNSATSVAEALEAALESSQVVVVSGTSLRVESAPCSRPVMG